MVLIALLLWTFVGSAAGATGLTWPTNQLLPGFPAPAPVLDCIDMSSSSSAEQDMFVSLEGIVNRTQPRIVCVSTSFDEGRFAWLTNDHLPYLVTNGYLVLQKFQTNVTGLVVTDTNLADTLNLATTMAGLNNELICAPSLLATLTNSPYNLAIKDDLRGRFSTKYQVYNYLYTNCWPLCTHRVIAGLDCTNLHGGLRDYLVAVKSATVWLDPGMPADATALQPFLAGMTPVNGVYLGWWPNEGNGLGWIAAYGIPVVASDFYDNGTVFGGLSPAISIPAIPPTPPLQTNKIYVSVTMSDGDNVQYMQRHMYVNWNNSARGSAPIGWTAQPLSALMDPAMLNYYWTTASTNDCLLAGPSGAGYAHVENWSSANLNAFAKLSNPWLQRSGMRAITIWDNLSSSTAAIYASNCPTLIGVNSQDDNYYTTTYHGLAAIGFPGDDSYTSTEALLYTGITNTAAGWSGTSPMFIAVQGSGWDISPADCQTLKNSLDPNKYVMVRPDHLFLLYRQYQGLGTGAVPYLVTQPAGAAVNVGTNITFNASATGTAPLRYQWRLNGTNLPGATNNFFTQANVQPADAGNYSILVTNIAGNAVSSNAALIVMVASTNIPNAMTLAPAPVLPGTINLRGAVVPNGAATTVWFEWGTNTSYGRQTAAANIGNSYLFTPVSAAISNLAMGGIYHFRCDASNALGVARGHDEIFSSGGWVKAWGDDSLGQTNVPAGLTNAVAVAAGDYHCLVLKNDGTVVAWGYDLYNQTDVPTNLSNVVAVAADFGNSVALKADGTLTGWGSDNTGQLNGTTNATGVIAIAAGEYHCLAVGSNGTVSAWGDNNDGQTNVPAGLKNVGAVAAGVYSSLALSADGTVAAWGDNFYGQTNVPAGLSNVVAISSGGYHCLALKADGTVTAWGLNNFGQTNVPPGLGTVAAIACGQDSSYALQTDGTLVAWGDDSDGQTNLPPALVNIAAFAGGMNHGVAIANFAPLASSQTAGGYVNHDLPITLTASPGDGSSLNYRIVTLPSLGMLYQYAGGGRGNVINLGNADVTDTAGRLLYAPATNAMGTPDDAFEFAANDGLNDSRPATVTVDLGLPAAPQMLSAPSLSEASQSFGFAFLGSSNATYSIWGSTNLTGWEWLGFAPEAAPGVYEFMDPAITNWPARFYRATAP